MKKAINIGSRREFFWDNYIVDEKNTTARYSYREAEFVKISMQLDRTYEQMISYPIVVKDDKGYKMYYIGYNALGNGKAYMCLLESDDGINWKKPNLRLYMYEDNLNNNIVLPDIADNLSVFYDTNPNCPAEEKYKAIGKGVMSDIVPGKKDFLLCYVSADGYNFVKSHAITDNGAFDSLNTFTWKDGKYTAYVRGYHWNDDAEETLKKRPDLVKIMPKPEVGVRDVMVMYSEDFRTWTEPEIIKFDDGLDLPLYTNNIEIYPRAPHMYVGFPTRYSERTAWTPNYDRLGKPEQRKEIMRRYEPRSGLAVTDCIFMSSRDGVMWHRTNKGFLLSGYEAPDNWVYGGDGYAAYGLVDAGDENYYMYTITCHLSHDIPCPLNLYKVRKDGFACREADGEEVVVTTKPIVYEGSKLYLNFETSGMGHIFVELYDTCGNLLGKSFELFGNNIDAEIQFEDGRDYSEYEGKEVVIRFRMLDARLYSFKFE